MLVLSLDAAAGSCAACVWDAAAGAERGRAVAAMRTGHAEHLMDVVGAALGQAGVGLGGLGRIAVCVGPGSFTGIRVGVAAARGLALALKIPAVGVSALEALAAQARNEAGRRPVLVALSAGESGVQAALYGAGGEEIRAPASIGIEAALAWGGEAEILAGSAAPRIATALAGRSLAAVAATADIAVYARLAARREPSSGKPVPLYLRAPDAKPQGAAVLPRRAG